MSGFPNAQNNGAGAIPVWGGSATVSSDGVVVDPSGWAKSFHYDGNINDYVEITDPNTSIVYRMTFTYNGDGQVLTSTQWTAQ